MEQASEGNHGKRVRLRTSGSFDVRNAVETEVSIPTERDTIDPELLVRTEEYVADGPAPFHEDWAVWKAYRREYETRTFTILVIRKSENVKKRNNQLAHSKKALVGLRKTLHLYSWLAKKISWDRSSSVAETLCKLLSFSFYGRKCISRRQVNQQIPLCEPILDDVRLMIRVGGERLRIYDYIRNHSKYKVAMKDVYNLMSRIRGEISGEASDDVAVAEFLLAFNEAEFPVLMNLTAAILAQFP
ncbi:hypothetical protein PHMEG_00028280 [Phytophthora megakarya]|uniref:Uncharacterized protein n=1 Tax=Phytophthora megakarya TaxID=4795 RepID=A0A225V5D0_9STRA|nr:hypothetical protein PHMEG_00028280 [Phytophthora megakarya]